MSNESLIEIEREPDLLYLRKKFLNVSEGSERFQSLGSAQAMTNDYEQWKQFVDIDPSEYTPVVPHNNDVFQPFDNPPYAEKYNQPFGGGGMGDLGPATSLEQEGLFGPATSLEEEGFLGQATTIEEEGLIGFLDIVGLSGLGETAAQRDERLAKEPIKWIKFQPTTFPKMNGMNNAKAKLSRMPNFSKNSMAALKKPLNLPSFSKYMNKIKALKLEYPDIKKAPIKSVKKMVIDTSKIKKNIDSWTKALTDKELRKIITVLPVAAAGYAKYINKNLPQEKYAIWTNLKRVIRIAKKTGEFNQTIVNNMVYLMKKMFVAWDVAKKFQVEFMENFKDLPDKAAKLFNDQKAKIESMMKYATKYIKDSANVYSDGVKNFFNKATGYIKSYLQDVADNIKSWISNLINAQKKDVETMSKWFQQRMTDITNGTVSDFNEIQDWLVKNITGLQDNLKINMTRVGDKLELRAKVKINKFQTQLNTIKSDLTRQFNDTVNKTKTQLQTYVKSTTIKFKRDMDTLQKDIETKYQDIKVKINKALEDLSKATEKTKELTGKLDVQETKIKEQAASLDKIKTDYGNRLTELEAKLKEMAGEKKSGFSFGW